MFSSLNHIGIIMKCQIILWSECLVVCKGEKIKQFGVYAGSN